MNKAVGPALTLLGAAMLIAAWAIYEPPVEDIGEVPTEVQAEPDEEPEPDPIDFPRPVLELPEGEEVVVADTEPEPEPEPEPETSVTFAEMPTSIQVPAINVDNAIVPVGLNDDGSMEIPHDVHELGWYDVQEVLPGDEGTAVLAGHVDSRTQGPGAFYDLRHLDLGDRIFIGDDQEQEWVVTARRSYGKNDIPIEDIFVDHGEPRLVLITCGGAFDRTARSYTDNIVVYAELV